MLRRRFFGSVYLYEQEASRIVLLLQDIKARDPGLVQALRRVLSGRLLKLFNKSRLDVYVDVNNEHASQDIPRRYRFSTRRLLDVVFEYQLKTHLSGFVLGR